MFDATLRTESRAGETPVLPGSPPQAFVAAVVTPRLDLQLRSPPTDWMLWYSPRLLWQTPHPPSSSDLLVLHTFGSSLSTRTSRTTELTGAVAGSIGQPDYTSLQQLLGTVQATLPPALEIAAGNVQARLAVQLSRRWAFGLSAEAAYWQWLQVPEGVPVSTTVTSALSVIGGPLMSFRATELDTFRIELPVSAAEYSTDSQIFAVSPAVAWRRALSRRTDLTLRLGMTYARSRFSSAISAPATAGGTESPIGSVAIASRLTSWNHVVLMARGSAGVDYYLDPILAVGVRRWVASAGVDAISTPNWAFGLRGDFATVIGQVPAAAGTVQPDETAFSVGLMVHSRLSANLFTEFGGLWADRGPPLETPDFHFHQRQLWVFLTIGATTAPVPRPTSGPR
jgi:hypothetical protein